MIMELTGKCLQDFKQFCLLNNSFRPDRDGDLYSEVFGDYVFNMPKNMLYGVYEDYFDSVGVYIQIETRLFDHEHPVYIDFKRDYKRVGIYKKRPEARDAAIEKANEIRNAYLESI